MLIRIAPAVHPKSLRHSRLEGIVRDPSGQPLVWQRLQQPRPTEHGSVDAQHLRTDLRRREQPPLSAAGPALWLL